MELPRRACILWHAFYYCLKFHNAHQKQVALLSGYDDKDLCTINNAQNVSIGKLSQCEHLSIVIYIYMHLWQMSVC